MRRTHLHRRSGMALEHSHTTVRDRLLEGLPIKQRQQEIDGITTSVLEGGHGPPLILLHGGIQAGGVIWWRGLPPPPAALLGGGSPPPRGGGGRPPPPP